MRKNKDINDLLNFLKQKIQEEEDKLLVEKHVIQTTYIRGKIKSYDDILEWYEDQLKLL